MKGSIDSPVVLLLEDRPKQRMVYQLNLSIYLDARVIPGNSIADLRKALGAKTGLHLVVMRSNLRLATVPRVIEMLGLQPAMIPVICMGDSVERRGMTIIEDALKPLLRTAAKLFDITPQSMVAKKRPDMYEISAEFLNLLFTFPCDVYDKGAKGLDKLFNAADEVPRAKVEQLARERCTLYIESIRRLKLANAVAEQALKAAEDLHDANLSDAKRLSILSASFDIVAAQFQSAGMDEETMRLADSSIKAIDKIADDATDAEALLKKLRADGGGYRYVHCQVITFLCFHVIKTLGWTDGEQRKALSQASFYHDISLSVDEHAKVHSSKSLASIQDRPTKERIYSHAHLAARELQAAPGISPTVVALVRRHHGSGTGRGFFTRIDKFDPLEKTFILAERWCDYLMELADTGAPPRHDEQLAFLRALFNDPVCHRILETFRLLSPDKFTSVPDAPSALLAAEAARAQEEEAELAEAEDLAAVAEGGEAAHGEGLAPEDADAGEAAEHADGASNDVHGLAGDGEASRTIKNVTYRRTDEASVVQDDSLAEKNVSKTIKNVTYRRTDEENVIEDDSLAEKNVSKTIKNVTYRRTDEENVIENDSLAEEAAPATVKGITAHRTDEESVIHADSLAEEETEKSFRGVTEIRSDEITRVKAAPEERDESEKKFGNTTHRRNDDEVLLPSTKETSRRLSALVKSEGPEGKQARGVLVALHQRKPGATIEDAEAALKAAGISLPKLAIAEKKIAAAHRREEEVRDVKKSSAAADEEPDTTHEYRVGAAKGEETPVKKLTSSSVGPEPTKKLAGVTDRRVDEEVVIKKRAVSAEDTAGEPEKVFAKSAADEAPEVARRIEAAAEEPQPEKTMTGVTYHRVDEKIVVRAREQRVMDVVAVPGPAGDKARSALAELHAAKPEATLAETEEALKAAGVELPGLESRITAVTEEFARRGPDQKEESKEWSLEGVTQVIKHKTFVFKNTGGDLVDQTVTRIRAEPRQETRELKVKTLAGSTELMKAALAGSAEKITEILALGNEELKKTDASGRTAVHFAAMGGSVPVLAALVGAGAAVNATDTKRRSPLFLAAMYQRKEAFDFLLDKGGKVAQQDSSGMTIAMLAAHSGNIAMLESAVKKGVRLEARDEKGRTALDFAKTAGHTSIVAYLESVTAKKVR